MRKFKDLPKYRGNTKTYAGIGSRKTPNSILEEMTTLAKLLSNMGYTLNSGGAVGADTAFEQGADKKNHY